MRRGKWFAGLLVALLWGTPALADNGFIVRSSLGSGALAQFCVLQGCTVVGNLDGTLNQVFLLTTPSTIDANTFLTLLRATPGIVDAELNQVLNLVGPNLVPASIPSTLMSDRSSVSYGGTNVWNSYANQTASGIVEVQNAQNSFNVTGTGIVADIDTGVDPTHPVLQPVLVPGYGYDFTRNQAGGSELNDLPPNFPTNHDCNSTTCPVPTKVNQSSAAILDQSSAAILDGGPYAAFGHGTMVMGIIHLVAPTAQLLPLKAFHSDGTASLSDILRAIYYAVQNGANVINMSFDTTTASTELQKALDYANQNGLICAASAGNDGMQEIVYPAALQNDVMGVASTTDQDTRSSFSNYGNTIVWVAAPGEAIVTTYPFSTYAAGWGTSFSAPFVSGGAALLYNLKSTIGESGAAAAASHAVPLTDTGMGNGRLDLCLALGSLAGASCSADYSVSAAPSAATITAGQQVSFTVSAAPLHGSTQTVAWTCTGAPAQTTCTVSPPSIMLNGTNPATATVTLTTTARAVLPPVLSPPLVPTMHVWEELTACLAWLAVSLMLWNLSRGSRQRPGLAAAAGLIAVALCTYSCGAGGYANTTGPPGSPTLYSLALSPTSVNGGSSSTATVTLNGPAPSGGAAVSLSSGNTAAATVPANVTVPAGSASATFTVSTSPVTASTPVTVSASYAGANQTASLTVTPAPPSGTPAGTFTVTVTGTSGNLSHSASFKLTVN